MSMDDRFATWYRKATTNLSEDLLKRRWEGISATVKKPDIEKTRKLAVLFLNPDQSEPEYLNEFRSTFVSFDNTYDISNDRLEIQILAGIALRLLIEGNSRLGDFAALLLVCSSFSDLSKRSADLTHIEAAQRFIATRGQITREPRLSLVIEGSTKQSPDLFKTLDEAAAANNTSTLNTSLKEHLVRLQNQISSLQRQIIELTEQDRIHAEDTNILWWLKSKQSRDLGIAFSDLKAAKASILFAKEVSDLTLRAPGHPSVMAIIDQALRHCQDYGQDKEISLMDAVISTPRDWRQKYYVKQDLNKLLQFCPISHAIVESLGVDEDDTWLPAYTKATTLKPRSKLPLLHIVHQAYLERELCKLGAGDVK